MNNERIDLTQFENFEHFETAPWVVSPEEAQVVIIPANHETMKEMRLYTGSMTISMAIAKVPELIAELKKCYEENDRLEELCYEFMGQALTLYDVGNQHKDVDYDYREFNKLRTRFAELLDFKSASE